MTPLIASLIEEAATSAGLEVSLVGAIVRVESAGDPYAWRPEPRYRWLWDVTRNRPFRELLADEITSAAAPPDFPSLAGSRNQEWTAQRASWGLMQLMGADAREEGFTAPFLTELIDPAANLTAGCRHLRGLVQWAGIHNVAQAAAGYNAGRGGWQSSAGSIYAAKVLKAIADISAHGLS